MHLRRGPIVQRPQHSDSFAFFLVAVNPVTDYAGPSAYTDGSVKARQTYYYATLWRIQSTVPWHRSRQRSDSRTPLCIRVTDRTNC